MELIITIVIWAAVIQGLLLRIIFITSRKHRSFANRLLGSFLLTKVAFDILNDNDGEISPAEFTDLD